ncbi:MAG: DUF2878 domain-containing protein [Hyphomicrobiaceae bacterium]
MTWRPLVPWLAFQIVWIVCAVGAANGHGAPGIAAAVVFTVSMLTRSREPARDALIVMASGVTGAIVESALVLAGVIRFAAPWPMETLAPAWIVALWIAFGATLPTFGEMLRAHKLKTAAALGALAGPLSYLAGARLGALEFVGSTTRTLLVLSVVWAAVLAGLIGIHARSGARAQVATD